MKSVKNLEASVGLFGQGILESQVSEAQSRRGIWAPSERRCCLACRILMLMIGARLKNEGVSLADAWSPRRRSLLPGSKTDSENDI